MNVVGSSGWLEYFADGPNADFFAPAVEDLDAQTYFAGLRWGAGGAWSFFESFSGEV
jgi:hypothetical protein